MLVPLRTLDQAIRLSGDLSHVAARADIAGVVLPALADLIGCDIATYNEIGGSPVEVHYDDWPIRALDGASQQVFARHVSEHPSVNHYRRTGSGDPVMISDFLNTREFHRLGLYAQFFRPIPVEHQLSTVLSVEGGTVVGIALNRARRPFNDLDRAVLTLLSGALRKALARATRPAPELTARELQILRFAAEGRTNVNIAHLLDLSPRTVAKHLEHIYGKFDVTCRSAAVAHAAKWIKY